MRKAEKKTREAEKSYFQDKKDFDQKYEIYLSNLHNMQETLQEDIYFKFINDEEATKQQKKLEAFKKNNDRSFFKKQTALKNIYKLPTYNPPPICTLEMYRLDVAKKSQQRRMH